MKRTLAIIFAVLLHVAVLLFGGLLFLHPEKKDHASLAKVELLTQSPDKPKKIEEPQPKPEQEQTKEDKPPDPDQIKDDKPNPGALADLNLSNISALLSGADLGGSDFGNGLGNGLEGDGIIGGTGKPGAGGGKTMQEAFGIDDIDQPARAVVQSPPAYPSDMHGKKGSVSLIFIVDPSGKVTKIKVEKSTDHGFEKAAVDAVKQWKFEPAVKAGKRVAFRAKVPIRFQPS